LQGFSIKSHKKCPGRQKRPPALNNDSPSGTHPGTTGGIWRKPKKIDGKLLQMVLLAITVRPFLTIFAAVSPQFAEEKALRRGRHLAQGPAVEPVP
jgi:hypothetical protein